MGDKLDLAIGNTAKRPLLDRLPVFLNMDVVSGVCCDVGVAIGEQCALPWSCK